MKTLSLAGKRHDHAGRAARNTHPACINCIFWYRCRDGRIDCDLKS